MTSSPAHARPGGPQPSGRARPGRKVA